MGTKKNINELLRRCITLLNSWKQLQEPFVLEPQDRLQKKAFGGYSFLLFYEAAIKIPALKKSKDTRNVI